MRDYKIKKTIIMEQLTYLVNWGKKKEIAWSGTNYSLYKALTKYLEMLSLDVNNILWIILGTLWLNVLFTSLVKKIKNRISVC